MKAANSIDHKKSKRKKTVYSQQLGAQIQPGIFEKFLKFVSAQRIDKLREHIKIFHGRNFPIAYKEQYNFREKWQSGDSIESPTDANLIEESGNVYLVFSVLLMLLNIATIWVISYERYFQDLSVSKRSRLFEVEIIFHMTDIALGAYYKQRILKYVDLKALITTNWHNLSCIAYFAFTSLWSIDHFLMYILDIGIIALLYIRAAEIYRFLKVMEFGLIYENQMKILDLLFNVFIQAHVFALILFSASKMNPEKNWVQAAMLGGEAALTKYIYAFYFASTTMLTIGYGDITPKCTEEIIVTVMIEIVAVVSFGYLLNEMGHTLSKMREQSEELERDLQTISKMSKYYNLERSLQNKAKAFLFSNQVRGEELKVDDEKRVLLKLNEELRQQIHHENSLTVIKSCVFFLCHWSKALQSELALRLQKRLFAPNERLVPSGGPARVFIIKRGRIDVFMNRFGGAHQRYGCSQQRRKLLKVIQTARKPEVSDNIYGYTAAFSNKAVRLEAVAAQFTSTYSVSRQEFIAAVRQTSHDFEYFHEIKCRIDQSAFCEQWEAPSINNIREHYAPSKIITIKKYRKKLQRSKNKRSMFIRHSKYPLKILQKFVNKSYQTSSDPNVQSFAEHTIEFAPKIDQVIKSQILTSKEQCESQSILLSSQSEDSYNKSYAMALQSLKTRLMTKSYQEKDNKKKISPYFEKYHEFHNFFRFNNISVVLNNLQRCNCLEKNIKINKFECDQPNKRKRLSICGFSY